MYNVWDPISRYIPQVDCLKLKSQNGLMIAILGRFLLIPAFYFTAKYVAPKGYNGLGHIVLGNLFVLFLLVGIFSGVALYWLWINGNGSF
ncbi:hypothetical protein CRG98_005289 [Punica granatum]|uniref:Uncharacterized protein n=1 Tax=Punica granatum TaxID=22663 RepID=A0A2I0L125_PUNGR|nr:hypothetical protein CRG98_005289 [Punica granatum]